MSEVVKSFWFGPRLSPFEVLSIRSFLDQGIIYHLYTYDEMDLPDGVVRLDAAAVIPKSRIFRVESAEGRGSVAPFADVFRYELLFREGGWWVDTDVVCLKPELPRSDCFFAWESPSIINCAVMKFSPRHEVMRACRDEALEKTSMTKWGSTGPELLKSVLERHQMVGKATDPSSCYPVNWRHILDFYNPAKADYVRALTSQAFAVHLWNEIIRRNGLNKFIAPPPESFLHHLFAQHKIRFPSESHYEFLDIVQLEDNRRLAESTVK
jgi:hypothetical protein